MSPQNTSSAVMQQRREPRDALDDFPTPPWATRALCEWLCQFHDLARASVREPAANRGHMVEPLAEYFGSVEASDVHDYGAGFAVRDYLWPPAPAEVDWTITNPPFRLAEQFINRALETSRCGVAIVARIAFLESETRYLSLFRDRPPTHILQFVERVVMHRGRLAPAGGTATCYCWLVWDKRAGLAGAPPALHWIPPGSRRRLERGTDYPAPAVQVADGGLFDG